MPSEPGRTLPYHVERELQAFLLCGDPVEGFGWLTCAPCDHHRLIPFSCKGRGFCPRCGGRRMAEKAARWVDTLLPKVAVRQWVLTVPWKRRWDLARHPKWARAVLRILIRQVQQLYRRRLCAPNGRTGSVTVIQRFGSALNLNVHFHVLMLDGLDDSDAALPEMQTASIQGRSAVTGKRARRVQQVGGREFELPPRCASFEVYNLHGNTAVAAKDRAGLHKLCRYVPRPPLAKDRVIVLPDGRVKYQLKRAWSNGVTDVVFTAEAFVERLAALVPPPRVNTVLYRGMLAARANDRARLLPRPTSLRQRARVHLTRVQGAIESRWTPWVELLRRVFGVDGLACPQCGEAMTLRSVVVRPPATTKVLAGLRPRGPP